MMKVSAKNKQKIVTSITCCCVCHLSTTHTSPLPFLFFIFLHASPQMLGKWERTLINPPEVEGCGDVPQWCDGDGANKHGWPVGVCEATVKVHILPLLSINLAPWLATSSSYKREFLTVLMSVEPACLPQKTVLFH